MRTTISDYAFEQLGYYKCPTDWVNTIYPDFFWEPVSYGLTTLNVLRGHNRVRHFIVEILRSRDVLQC